MTTQTLQVGDPAPSFVAKTGDGHTIRLEDFLGQRGLVLFFYPRDGTPVCTKQACAFRDSYSRFVDAGFEVVGVSSGSASSHQAFARQHQLPFPLISDTDGSLRRLYGASQALGIIPGRVTYVIDREGRIRLAYSALFAADEHVRQALAAVGAASPPAQ